MAFSPPVNKECAREALIVCTDDICRKIDFSQIITKAVAEKIIDIDYADEIEQRGGNVQKMMGFLRQLLQTDLCVTFPIFLNTIIPQNTVAGKQCKERLHAEYIEHKNKGK